MSVEISLATVLARCGGDPEQAARQLSRAIAAAPTDPAAYVAAVELLPELGELSDDDPSVAPILAFRYFLEGRMDEAALTLGEFDRSAAEIDPAYGR